MTIGAIEIMPEGTGWKVLFNSEACGDFGAAAEAVSYALSLSDKIAPHSRQPRIRVFFQHPSSRDGGRDTYRC